MFIFILNKLISEIVQYRMDAENEFMKLLSWINVSWTSYYKLTALKMFKKCLK